MFFNDCPGRNRATRNSLWLCLLLSGFIGSAQPSRTFTLEQAMETGAREYGSIQAARIRLAQSELQTDIAREKRLPDLQLNGSYSRLTPLTEWKEHYREGVDYHIIPEMYETSVGLRMPLFQGGKLRFDVARSREQETAEGIRVERQQSEHRRRIARDFIDLFKLMRLQGFIDQSIAAGRKREQEQLSRYRLGAVNRNEWLRAGVQLAERQQDSLTNQKQILVLRDALQHWVHLPPGEAFVADTLGMLEPPQEEAELSDDVSQNEEIRLSLSQERRAAWDIRSARSVFFPTVSLFGNYALKYPNNLFFPQDPFPYTLGQIGIALEFSLTGIWKERKNLARTRIQADKVRIETGLIEEEVAHALVTLRLENAELRQRLLLARKAEELARENYRIVQARFRNHMVLPTEMVDADNAWLRTRYEYAAIQADLRYNAIQIRFITGKL